MERRYIRRVLRATGGNKTRAAQVLGLDRRTLYRKLSLNTFEKGISMTDKKIPSTILVAVDFSELGDLALDQGIVRAVRDEATLHVVHVAATNSPPLMTDTVYPRRTPSFENLEETLIAKVRERLELAAAVPETGAVAHLRAGSIPEEIVNVGAELDADLIVLGTHGRRGIQRVILGSVAERVVRTATCPVIVMRLKQHSTAEIERPCPVCVAARRESGGTELWCEQHRHGLGRRHTYHFVSRNVAARENMPLVMQPGATSEPLRHH